MGVGCSSPDPPPAFAVRPDDLARAYRDSPETADAAYRGQLVRLPAYHTERRAGRLVWSLGAASKCPPVIVLEFPGEPPRPAPGLWVEGRCLGATADGLARELPGYTFTIRVAGCRVIPPPTPAP